MNNGYNPLRWDCEKEGACYNVKHRPKIEVFAECFPGRINFGDLDASIVEINSRALLLEWKGAPVAIPTGQHLTYTNLSRTGLLVVVTVAGDAETMKVTHFGFYIGGKFSGWIVGTLDTVKEVCRRWAIKAKALPPVITRKALPHEKISKRDFDEWVADYSAHEHDFDDLLSHRDGRRQGVAA
jgi:hypothetical protein